MPEASTAPVKRKLRPARKQVKPGEIDKSEGIQPGKEYNVWYNKWAGGDKEDELANKTLSQSRCVIIRDAGYTRADLTGQKYCCLFFARGCCPYGHDCNFLHRLPLPTRLGYLKAQSSVEDDSHQLPDNSRDCFGRDKHGEYRDDMGGVGSFNRVNRTIYIARMQESPDRKQTEETLLRHFGEWGKILKWNILHGRGIAFVMYESELNAQFAKEAMANQSLDMEEVLNVRWATEDPNPGAIKEEAKRIETMGREAIKNMLDEDLVEAAQTIRALEEEDEQDYYPIENSAPSAQSNASNAVTGRRGGIGASGTKRTRVDDDDEDEPDRRRQNGSAASNGGSRTGGAASGAGGLLSEDAMENLRFYAEMAKKQAEEDRAKRAAASKKESALAKPSGMALLGGYDSGDDSE